MEIAKFYCHDEISAIPAATGGTAMPFSSAYMPTGIYTLGGQSWDCTRSGLYVFKVEGEQFFRNRIVYSSPLDLYALLSAVSWNHVHGSEDNGTNYQIISNRGQYVRWRLQCGFIAGMMVWLLPQVGVTARTVAVSTLGPLNGMDDGHIVLETQHGGVWRMWDMTNGCYWKDANGVHLSTAAFIAAIANGGPLPEKVKLDGTDKRWQVSAVATSGGMLDLGRYGDEFIGTPAQQEAWLRRIFQQIV